MNTSRHLTLKYRKLGDTSYLSWNKPGGGLPENKIRKKKMKKQE